MTASINTHVKSNPVRLTALALALLAAPFTAHSQNYTASSNSSAGNITISSGNHTISVGSSGARTLSNAITLSGGTLQGGIMDNVATVSGLSGAGNSTTYVDVNGVTIILRGSGTTNTTANLTLASGVSITGANQLLVGGGAGGAGGRSGRIDGGGGGGGSVVLTTGNLTGTLALTAGGGGAGAVTQDYNPSASGGTSSIGATTASGGGGAAPSMTSNNRPTGKGGSSGQTINGTTTAFTGGSGGSATNVTGGGGGGAGSSANGVTSVWNSRVGGAGGNGTQITTGVVGLSTYLGSDTFGGGGGGGGDWGGGAGGAGGGGAGSSWGGAGTNGLGGGGGGATNYTGGAGGAGSVAIQYAYNSNVAAGTLTLSGGITLSSISTLDAVRSGGLIDVTGAITGAGGLNIASSASSGGVVRLSVNNTYTGNTTISTGTLKLTAAGNTGSGAVSLGTVGTLDVSEKAGGHTIGTLIGSGTVTGNLTVSTQLAIGNSPGTTNFNGNLTLGAESTYNYELTGGASPGLGSADLGIVAGDLTITAGSILDLAQLGTYTVANKFTLFAYSGTHSGTFKDANGNTLTEGSTFTDAGGVWTIYYADSTAGANGGQAEGYSYVTIAAIPEPSVLTLLGSLGAFALLRRKR